MLEPVARPKENSSSSTDSFDSDRAPMKHHRIYHRSSSPPLEVLKQTNIVEGTAVNKNLLKMETVIFYVGSALLGASLEGKNGTQANFLVDKEDLVLEVVGAIPSEDVIVDNVIPSPLLSLLLLAIKQTVVPDAEEEDVDDYARIVAKVILSKLFSRFKWTPLDQLHSLSSFVDKTFNLF
ncbi:hypothetical protein MRB53_002384 [Persea americana]|uniref:Uncharacterized protein n=1 Tax=Persea americana TaxID=3435 RepID=A0ACC2MUB1_PERAE|nr:hypothetical protein MRB53_002384 [Persea americana]